MKLHEEFKLYENMWDDDSNRDWDDDFNIFSILNDLLIAAKIEKITQRLLLPNADANKAKNVIQQWANTKSLGTVEFLDAAKPIESTANFDNKVVLINNFGALTTTAKAQWDWESFIFSDKPIICVVIPTGEINDTLSSKFHAIYTGSLEMPTTETTLAEANTNNFETIDPFDMSAFLNALEDICAERLRAVSLNGRRNGCKCITYQDETIYDGYWASRTEYNGSVITLVSCPTVMANQCLKNLKHGVMLANRRLNELFTKAVEEFALSLNISNIITSGISVKEADMDIFGYVAPADHTLFEVSVEYTVKK